MSPIVLPRETASLLSAGARCLALAAGASRCRLLICRPDGLWCQPDGPEPTWEALSGAWRSRWEALAADGLLALPAPELGWLEALAPGARTAVPLGPSGLALLWETDPQSWSAERRELVRAQAEALGAGLDGLGASAAGPGALSPLWERLAEGVALFDADARLVDANPAARRLLGACPEPLAEWEPRLRLPDGRLPAPEQLPAARVRGATAFSHWDVLVGTSNAMPRSLRLSGLPLPPGSCGEAAYALLMLDTTLLRRREKELNVLFSLTAASADAAAPTELFDRVLASILEIAQVEGGLLYYRDVHARIPYMTHSGLPEELVTAIRASEEHAGMASLYRQLVDEEDSHLPDMLRAQLGRWIVLPLHRLDQLSGLLVLAATDYHQLSDNLSRLLSTILHHLLLSMELHQALGMMEELVQQRTAELWDSHRRLESTVTELKRMDQFKTDFLSNVSHELRTPLSGIIGYGEFLAEGVYGELSTEQQDVMQQLVNNSYQLMELINNLLDLSRIDAGRLLLYKEPIELGVLFQQAMGKVLPHALKKQISLVAPDEVPFTVEVDPGRIVQVLVNLLANAIKFTPEGGRVAVTVEAAGELVTVSVADTGIGIASEQLPRLFRRFAQGDSSTTRQFGGTGLGLAISRELIELHEQHIWAESTPGDGSTFHFTLPQWEMAAELTSTKR